VFSSICVKINLNLLRLLFGVVLFFSQDSAQFLYAQLTEGIVVGNRTHYLSDNPRVETLDFFVDSLLKSFMQSPQNCGISIAISNNNSKRFYNYGEQKRNSNLLPLNSCIYEIGSVTNIFLGLLLAEAVLDNKLALTDDICNYLPTGYSNLNNKNRVIQIQHLIAHTSGLPRLPLNLKEQIEFDSLNPFKNYNDVLLLKDLKNTIIAEEPGKVSNYSVLGIATLEFILEQVYGSSFDKLVKDKILNKTAMLNSAIRLSAEQKQLTTQGYTVEGDTACTSSFGEISSVGGMHSSAADLTLLLELMMSADPVAHQACQSTFKGRGEASYGWFVKQHQGRKFLWQNGGTQGFSAFCGFVKEKNFSVVLLANSGRNIDYLALALLNYMIK